MSATHDQLILNLSIELKALRRRAFERWWGDGLRDDRCRWRKIGRLALRLVTLMDGQPLPEVIDPEDPPLCPACGSDRRPASDYAPDSTMYPDRPPGPWVAPRCPNCGSGPWDIDWWHFSGAYDRSGNLGQRWHDPARERPRLPHSRDRYWKRRRTGRRRHGHTT